MRNYDPSDRTHDSARLDALGVLLRKLADAQPSLGQSDPWAHLCAYKRRTDGTFAFEIVMPVRCGQASHSSVYSLMGSVSETMDARYYDTPEDAVRALLDNVIYELHGPRAPEVRLQHIATVDLTRNVPANIGGEGHGF